MQGETSEVSAGYLLAEGGLFSNVAFPVREWLAPRASVLFCWRCVPSQGATSSNAVWDMGGSEGVGEEGGYMIGSSLRIHCTGYCEVISPVIVI